MASRNKSEQVRQQIIAGTSTLLYQKGFNAMSFTDIAAASGIPRGNLNYHFKTKQAILSAVIDYRLAQTRAMLLDWEQSYPIPLQRLKRYARIPLNESDNVIQYGCPMGSLNTELGKHQATLQAITRQQFDLFREWLGTQFKIVSPNGNADELALHLLTRSQGVAIMAQSYQDPALIEREVGAMIDWLDSVDTGHIR